MRQIPESVRKKADTSALLSVHLLDVRGLPDPRTFAGWKDFLPEERLEKTVRLRGENARKATLGAWLLLYAALKQEGLHALPGSYTYGVYGKPQREDIFFNLSHAGRCALCVVSDREVGCDIERVRPISTRLTDRLFSDEERRLLAGLSGAARDEMSVRLWTLRESYVKKTGEGFSAMEGICFSPQEGHFFRGGRQLSEHFFEMDAGQMPALKGCRLSVCTDGDLAVSELPAPTFWDAEALLAAIDIVL